MNVGATIGAVLLSYALGSVPTGLWLGLWLRKVDIREHGSRNIGATNTLRVLGKKLGAVALLGDMAKGIAPVKPETQVIKPGTIFAVGGDEFNVLFAAGAIRVPDPTEQVYVPVSVAEVADEDEDDNPAKAANPAKAE